MFYECQNGEQELAAELFKILCNNLRRQFRGDDGSGDITNPTKLKEFMKEYSMREWKKKFNFEYKGEHSEPPNRTPSGRITAYSKLFQVETYPVSQNVVEPWMEDANIFR